MVPHICPKCHGDCEVIKDCRFVPCNVCKDEQGNSRGYVWEKTLADAIREDAAQNVVTLLHGKAAMV